MKKDTRLFWEYVAPSITGMIIGGSFCIVDTIFIGQYGGKNALAAVALTWPVVMLLQAFGSLIGAGGAVLISQKHGAGQIEQEKTLFSQTLFLTLFSSIILFAATYPFLKPILSMLGATPEMMPLSLRYAQILTAGLILSIFMAVCLEVIRNDGHPTLSMILMIAGLGGNIILDWLWIFFFDLGTTGAAIATVSSMGLACLLGFIYFLSPLTKLKFSLQLFIPKRQEIKEICITGLPVFGNMLSIIAMLYMHNAQSLKYGKVDGLAAYTVISALEALGSMFMTGVAAGIQPLAATMYGAGKYKRQNRFGNYAYYFSFISGIIIMLFSFAMHKVMPGWMGLESGHVYEIASQGIIISATAFLFLGVIRVAAFYYQATGNIAKSSWLIYGDSFIALPLCIYTLPIFFGMNGVWLAMPVSRILLMGLLLYFWYGVRKKYPAN